MEIERWAAGGRGVGRVEGRVWLIAGAVPGDRVEARVVRDRGRYVEATAARLVRPSPSRRAPPCPIQAECGGCPLMVVGEREQQSAKHGMVVDALERIGRFRGVRVDDPVAVEPALGYRTKIELTAGRDPQGRAVIGYHRADAPAALIDVERCAIADPALAPLLEIARAALRDDSGPLGFRLGFRVARASGETVVVVRGWSGPIAPLAALARAAMSADPRLAGVVRITSAPGRRGGATSEVIAGRGSITEDLLGTTFELPAGAFVQVHAEAAARLGSDLLAGIGAPQDLVELYGGVGAVGIAVTKRGAKATVVDADAEAIACGAEAARRAGVEVAFRRSDVLRFLEHDAGRTPPAVVVADPPRAGFGPGVAARLVAWGAARVAIVSCDPATLARDCAALRTGGYELTSVTPYDFFPQTAHVEAVAWLRLVRPPPAAPRREGSC